MRETNKYLYLYLCSMFESIKFHLMPLDRRVEHMCQAIQEKSPNMVAHSAAYKSGSNLKELDFVAFIYSGCPPTILSYRQLVKRYQEL